MQREITVEVVNGRKIFRVEVPDDLTSDQIMELMDDIRKKLYESKQPPQILID